MAERTIPLSVPNLKGNEIDYVTNAIESEWVSTAGSYVKEFENVVANYVGVDSAVACQSGTAGLHVALMLCGVTNADAVIVPTLTFIAAVNPVSYIGAKPLFMDCDDSLCINPDAVREFCDNECSWEDNHLVHNKTKRKIKAMVVVHVFGNMANMESLVDIAEKYNIKIVEDATEALGTRYDTGRYAYKFAGTIGDIGVYSFNGNKIITTGGGGMIVSQNKEYIAHARHLTTQAKSDELYFEHDAVGYNYRLTNLQAALGLAQMEQLDKFIETKKENYHIYLELLEDYSEGSLLSFRDGTRSNYWFYSLFCKDPQDRDLIIKELSQKNIQTRPIWGLIHEQAPYVHEYSYCIKTAPLFRRSVVNLPCSTNLNYNDVERVVSAIKGVSYAK